MTYLDAYDVTVSEWDLTIVGDDGSPWFGALDEDGRVVESDFQADGGPRPYLRQPASVSSTEIDFPAGASRIGAVTLEVVDKRLDPTDQDSGIVTSRIAEAVGSRAILRRREGEDMLVVMDGVLSAYAVDSGSIVTYRFEVRDGRERERETRLFERNETFVLYGKDAATGPADPYGELPGGDYLLDAVEPATGAATTTVKDHPTGMAWAFVPIERSPFLAQFGEPSPDGSQVIDWDGGLGLNEFETLFAHYPDLTVRWREVGSEEWIYLRDMPTFAFGSDGFRNAHAGAYESGVFLSGTDSGFTVGAPSLRISSWDADQIPDAGVAIEFQALAVPTSESSPFFWDRGSLGTLLREIYDGEHTRGQTRIRYSAEAMDAFGAATPPARLFLTEGVRDMRRWVEENIYAAAGWAPAFDRDLKIRPVRWRLPIQNELAGLLVLDPDSIVPVGDWSSDAAHIINSVEYTYIRESLTPEDEPPPPPPRRRSRWVRFRNWITGRSSASPQTEEQEVPDPWERLEERDVVRVRADIPSVAAVGRKSLEYSPVTIRSIADVDGRPLSGDTADETGSQVAESIATQALERFRRDAPRYVATCHVSDDVLGVQLGDWVRCRVPWMPQYDTAKRGARRIMQVVRIDDAEPHQRTFTLQDSRVAEAADLAPTMPTIMVNPRLAMSSALGLSGLEIIGIGDLEDQTVHYVQTGSSAVGGSLRRAMAAVTPDELYAFIGTWSTGQAGAENNKIQTLDISDPTNPIELEQRQWTTDVTNGGGSWGNLGVSGPKLVAVFLDNLTDRVLALQGTSSAFLVSGTSSNLIVYDWSNRAALSVLAVIPLPGVRATKQVVSVSQDGRTLYVAGKTSSGNNPCLARYRLAADGLSIEDHTILTDGAFAWADGHQFHPGPLFDEVTGRLWAVGPQVSDTGSRRDWIYEIDWSNPTAPSVTAVHDVGDGALIYRLRAGALSLDGNYLYVTSAMDGDGNEVESLVALDASTPGTLPVVGKVSNANFLPSETEGGLQQHLTIHPDGRHAVLTNGSVVNVEDPENPVLVNVGSNRIGRSGGVLYGHSTNRFIPGVETLIEPAPPDVTPQPDGTIEIEVTFPDDPPDGYTITVEYAVGDEEPGEDSGDWRFVAVLSEAGTVSIPAVPDGATVWTRVQGAAPGFLPTATTEPTSEETTSAPRLRSLGATVDEGTVTVLWDANAATAGVRVRYRIHNADSPPASVGNATDHDAGDGSAVLADELPRNRTITIEVTPYPEFSGGSVSGDPGQALFIQRGRYPDPTVEAALDDVYCPPDVVFSQVPIPIRTSDFCIVRTGGPLPTVPDTLGGNDGEEWVFVGAPEQAAWFGVHVEPVDGRAVAVAASNAVSNNFAMFSDDDGESWTMSDTAASGLRALDRNPTSGRYVAVGGTGSHRMQFSDNDGETFTESPGSINTRAWWDVLYDAARSRWVAVGETHAAYSDDDGASWTEVALDRAVSSVALHAQSGRLVAVGEFAAGSGRVLGSDDGGETWSELSATPFRTVRYNPATERLVAVRFGGIVGPETDSVAGTSDDGGETWTTRTGPNMGWWGLSRNPNSGRWVAAASQGNHDEVMTSDDDGETWTGRSVGQVGWTGVAINPVTSRWVAVAGSGIFRIMLSGPGD